MGTAISVSTRTGWGGSTVTTAKILRSYSNLHGTTILTDAGPSDSNIFQSWTCPYGHFQLKLILYAIASSDGLFPAFRHDTPSNMRDDPPIGGDDARVHLCWASAGLCPTQTISPQHKQHFL